MKSYGGLRAQELDDIPYLQMWRNFTEVMEGTTEDIWPMTLDAAKELFVERTKAPGRTMTIQQKDGSPVGEVQLFAVDNRNRSAELRILIGEPALWGKGYGKAAANEFLGQCFDAIPLNRVTSRVPVFNKRGTALFERLGFKREGVERKSLFRNGKYHDVAVFSLLRAEWEARDARR